MKNQCIFCDIVNKKEQGFVLFENDLVCCILDKYPINKGHILVIPKKHYEEFTEVEDTTLHEVISTAKKMAIVVEKLFKTDGITIMQNNGIFKDVDHYHLHIVPRFENDGFAWVDPDFEMTTAELENVQKIILHEIK